MAQIGVLVEAGKVKPLVSDQRVSTQEIAAAHGLVESGSLGKVVVDI